MKTNLLFGIHCHQPIDNFDEVIYNAIEKSYKPFFEVLKDYPNFKCSVHYSGWLLEFIEKNDPELFSLMKSLSNQLEFFTGGYYEPILASIPSKDRIAQIKKLNSYIKKHFAQTPKGLWLTERVWDDSIINDLSECGIKYVIVDDYHFISSGYTKELNGYFVTENDGNPIALFPISKSLRYAIPFANITQTQELLHSFINIEGKNASIIFDDGEKFGIWPKTYERCYEKEWLNDFFLTCMNDENIISQTFNEFYESNHAMNLAYLPKVSYAEMGEWSLNASDAIKLKELEKSPQIADFLKGGIWKNFFNKYQESNWIHKRYLELSRKQLDSKTYKDNLYKAQCNDVLWHGVFGGIYLPNLRDNAYKYLIECEKELLDFNQKGQDIDFDTYDEFKFNMQNLLTIISPKNGGQIFELDIKDRSFNLQNTLTRYKEAYHEKIEILEENHEEIVETIHDDSIETIHTDKLTIQNDINLHYDWYLKKSAIDHISTPTINFEDFESCTFKEFGDFANQEFLVDKRSKNKLILKRSGGIYKNDEAYPTTLIKTYKFDNEKIDVNVDIDTMFEEPFSYVQEWNLHFMDVSQLEINNFLFEDKMLINAKKLTIVDKLLNKNIIFSFDKEIIIYIYKIDTISQSEMGVDVTTQGLSFGFINSSQKSFKTTFEIQ